jgi:tetratricopeptide (TPR) repeat protein
MQNAVWRGLPDAYAQRSRSLLLDNKHEEALKAIALCLANTQHDGVKSACFKNRGWVRLKQKQHDGAEIDFKTAIKFQDNSAEAHCLLAEVLETKGQPQSALEHWQKTIKYSNSSVPKQDRCIQNAQQRLEKKGNIK